MKTLICFAIMLTSPTPTPTEVPKGATLRGTTLHLSGNPSIERGVWLAWINEDGNLQTFRIRKKVTITEE